MPSQTGVGEGVGTGIGAGAGVGIGVGIGAPGALGIQICDPICRFDGFTFGFAFKIASNVTL